MLVGGGCKAPVEGKVGEEAPVRNLSELAFKNFARRVGVLVERPRSRGFRTPRRRPRRCPVERSFFQSLQVPDKAKVGEGLHELFELALAGFVRGVGIGSTGPRIGQHMRIAEDMAISRIGSGSQLAD